MTVQYSYPTCRTPRCRTIPTPGYATWGLCPHCELDGRGAIAALPYDYDDLGPLVWNKTPARHDTGRIDAHFGPSVPLDVEADALRHEIDYTLDQWEEIVREREQLSESAGYPSAAAAILLVHFGALIRVPRQTVATYGREIVEMDGVDAIIRFAELHRRAASRTGVTDLDRLAGYCSACGRADTLRHRNGDENIHCSYCGMVCTWDDYQDMISIVPVRRAA